MILSTEGEERRSESDATASESGDDEVDEGIGLGVDGRGRRGRGVRRRRRFDEFEDESAVETGGEFPGIDEHIGGLAMEGAIEAGRVGRQGGADHPPEPPGQQPVFRAALPALVHRSPPATTRLLFQG